MKYITPSQLSAFRGTDTTILNAKLNGKVNYTDSLVKYVTPSQLGTFRGMDSTALNAKLNGKVNYTDSLVRYVTPSQLGALRGTDTTVLNAKLNGKVNYTDSLLKYVTPSQLGAFRDIDTTAFNSKLNGKVNYTDSLVKYVTPSQLGAFRGTDTTVLNAKLNGKVNYTDSLVKYVTPSQLGALRGTDTTVLNAKLNGKVNYTDSLVKYVTPSQLGALRGTDTTLLNAKLNGKVNYTDSLVRYVTPSQLGALRGTDTTVLNAKLNGKVNYTDSLVKYVTPSQLIKNTTKYTDSAYVFGTDTSTIDNVYSIISSVKCTDYFLGMTVVFKAHASNTDSSYIKLNGMRSVFIKNNINKKLIANDILNNQMVSMVYDGLNFQIISGTVKNTTIYSSAFDSTLSSHGSIIITRDTFIVFNNRSLEISIWGANGGPSGDIYTFIGGLCKQSPGGNGAFVNLSYSTQINDTIFFHVGTRGTAGGGVYVPTPCCSGALFRAGNGTDGGFSSVGNSSEAVVIAQGGVGGIGGETRIAFYCVCGTAGVNGTLIYGSNILNSGYIMRYSGTFASHPNHYGISPSGGNGLILIRY